jgi:hypothetical protein
MTEISIEPFTQDHLDGLIALVAAEGWTEYTDDVERTHRALTAPGVTTLVAMAQGQLVGAIGRRHPGPRLNASHRPKLTRIRAGIQTAAPRPRARGRRAA